MLITPGYFDLAGASQYTGGALSIRTLRRLISRPGGLPYYRIGKGKIMLRRTDLDAYLEDHRHEPMDLNALADQAVRELRGAGK
jgi:excisionase family DNA binding protein